MTELTYQYLKSEFGHHLIQFIKEDIPVSIIVGVPRGFGKNGELKNERDETIAYLEIPTREVLDTILEAFGLEVDSFHFRGPDRKLLQELGIS